MKMRVFVVLFTLLVGARGLAGDSDARIAIDGAARELSKQLDFLQRAIASLPGPPDRRDLFVSAEKLQFDLIYFQQQLKRQVSREALTLAFDKLDERMNGVMEELQPIEKWDQNVRMTARRVRSAEHDLHFALFGGAVGDKDAAGRDTQALYRQTLVLLTRAEDLESLAKYVFDDRQTARRWTDDIEDLRLALVSFQRGQKSKLGRDELKARFIEADRDWEKLVGKFRALPERQYYLLRSDAVQIDQAFARIARAFGIKATREKLPGNSID
ncbi:MAG: hypothetical protein FJ271_17445 [Planctomycetes bacterium]|nr:hypothetical protein [Planctomycetota bacterium]